MKMTKIRRYTLPGTAALAVAASLGLANSAAQAAAIVTYTGCANSSYCTLAELLGGGSIKVDENGDGTAEKTFSKWTGYNFSKSGLGNNLADPQNNIRVSASGSLGFDSGSATLNYTVVNDALRLAPTSTTAASLWRALLDFSFDVTSAEFVPIIEQKDALTGGSVLGPGSLGSTIALNNASLTSTLNTLKTIPPVVTNSDFSPLTPVNTLTVANSLSLEARRTVGTNGVAGYANLTGFSQTFTQVVIPEPGTVAGLLVVGGLGLAMKRREKDN